MKSLTIPFYSFLEKQEIKTAANFFEQNGTFEYIDMLNWPTQFPYKPDCRFKIARSLDSLFIHFKVTEKNIKAIYKTDHEPVWEDSCVEFFCRLPEQKNYFNFEFNCIGTCLATNREGRSENIIPFTKEQLNCIKRYASLGNTPFDEKEGIFEWKLTIEIPLFLIGAIPGKIPDKLNANFYKCGDGTSTPHYLSWSLISTETPDFHRPEYFGDINFIS